LLITDAYGRVQNAEIIPDAWVKASVIGDVDTPQVKIWHDNPNVNEKDTPSKKDLNELSADGKVQNTLTLESTVLDDKGHAKYLHQETVTLPYGFKEIKTSTSNAVTNYAGNTSTITAESTQDIVQFDSKNKWINIGV
jgi:hypothetical protein